MGVNANGNVDEPWFLTHTSSVLASAKWVQILLIAVGLVAKKNNLFQTVYNEYGCITLGSIDMAKIMEDHPIQLILIHVILRLLIM